MAKFINEPSHTFNEYLLIPGYSSAECVPANVSLKRLPPERPLWLLPLLCSPPAVRSSRSATAWHTLT